MTDGLVLSAPAILGRSLSLWRSHFLLLSGITALVHAPLVAWAVAATLLLESTPSSLIAKAVSVALGALSAGAVAQAVGVVLTGASTTVHGALRRGVSRWPAIVATEFTVVLAGLLAAVVTLVLAFAIAEVARQLGAEDPWLPVLRWFGLPAVVLSQGLVFCRFWVTLAVAGVEEVAPPLAISRSRDLLRGKWLHVALLVATFGAAHVLSFLSFLFALTKADDAGHVAIAAWAFVLFDVLVLGPLAAIAAAVTYFAARARESGASIGAAAAAAHPP